MSSSTDGCSTNWMTKWLAAFVSSARKRETHYGVRRKKWAARLIRWERFFSSTECPSRSLGCSSITKASRIGSGARSKKRRGRKHKQLLGTGGGAAADEVAAYLP